MIKDENYYVVHGWMRNRLALRGNELLIYAVLYGFTQDGVSEFRGTLEYISEFVGSTTRTTRSILNSLCEKGLVDKIEYNSESGKANGYKCHEGGAEKISSPSEKIADGGGKNFLPPSTKLKDKEIDKESYMKERKKEIKEIYSSSAGAGARAEDDENIFLKMTDEELIAWGDNPPDTSNPEWSKLLEDWYDESRRRATGNAKWKGKIIGTNGSLKRLESHEQIIKGFGCSPRVEIKLKEFLRGCYIQGYLVPNEQLENIIGELERYYDTDDEKIAVIQRAINGGYRDIKRLAAL